MPLGRLVLVRKGSVYGAIRLNTYERGKQNLFKTTYYTTYDAWYQGDGSGEFGRNNVKHQAGKASQRLYGLGRMAFDFSSPEISCGTFNLLFAASGGIIFPNPAKDIGKQEIEFAPTKSTDISQVDVLMPRMKWYRRDKSRSCFDVPIDTLW